MLEPLSSETISIVKATVPALEARGLDIVKEMYSRLFQNAEIRDMFNQSHQGASDAQPRALTAAILAYASNVDNLAVLTPAVERIAQKHVGLQILPEHYPHVGEALLGAIRAVLGDAAKPEIMDAWEKAYGFLANVLIAREKAIYDDSADAQGGWRGWRTFRIDRIEKESEIIKSFYLRPVDGGAVIRHKPGQYLTFDIRIPGHPPLKRNYSISNAANGQEYRISVKREPQGLVSGWLHEQVKVGDTLQVGVPAGEFFLEDSERPVVLLSGGVGITPMIAMLETLAEKHPEKEVHFAHGTLDGSTHAMGNHVRELVGKQAKGRVTIFYQHARPEDQGQKGSRYDVDGLIDADWLVANTPVHDADYFLCGPRPFLRNLVSALSLSGVAHDRIHYEFFGPADELLAA